MQPTDDDLASSNYADVIGKGDRRLSLEATRDLIASRLQWASPGETAALARIMLITLRELNETPEDDPHDPISDIAATIARKTAG